MTSRGHRRRGRRDESGVALVVAIAVTFIVILLSLAALRQSTNGITQFGIANKQVSSIDASESGVQYELDAMNAAVTASASTFTCASSTTLGTGVTYHLMVAQVAGTTAPTASNLAACSGSVPLTAGDTYLFQSTGTTTSNAFGARTTQATIYVPAATGTTGTVFDQTVFGNTALNITNGLTVTGTAGGLYSNGNWSCATQQTVTGAVTIYGTSTLSQSCAISGNLWSSGSVSFDTGAYVTGWTETPLAASYTANTNGAHSGALYSGSRSGITCGSGQLFSSCTTYSSATAPTPTAKETFPTLPFVCATPSLANCGSSPWGSAWTVDNDTSCNFNNAVYDGSNGGTGTILYWPSACGTLTTPSNSTLPISNNFALVAPGGVNLYNSPTPFSNSTGRDYVVYVIVPSAVTSGTAKTTTTCSGGNPMLQGNSTESFPSSLSVGLFTPCDINFQNGITSMTGQLYAGGTLTKGGNSLIVTGAQMTISGATGGGQVASAAGSATPVLNTEFQAVDPSGYN